MTPEREREVRSMTSWAFVGTIEEGNNFGKLQLALAEVLGELYAWKKKAAEAEVKLGHLSKADERGEDLLKQRYEKMEGLRKERDTFRAQLEEAKRERFEQIENLRTQLREANIRASGAYVTSAERDALSERAEVAERERDETKDAMAWERAAFEDQRFRLEAAERERDHFKANLDNVTRALTEKCMEIAARERAQWPGFSAPETALVETQKKLVAAERERDIANHECNALIEAVLDADARAEAAERKLAQSEYGALSQEVADMAMRVRAAERERDEFREALESVSMSPAMGRDGSGYAVAVARKALGKLDGDVIGSEIYSQTSGLLEQLRASEALAAKRGEAIKRLLPFLPSGTPGSKNWEHSEHFRAVTEARAALEGDGT